MKSDGKGKSKGLFLHFTGGPKCIHELRINDFKGFDLIPVIKLQHLEYYRLNTDMKILKGRRKRMVLWKKTPTTFDEW